MPEARLTEIEPGGAWHLDIEGERLEGYWQQWFATVDPEAYSACWDK